MPSYNPTDTPVITQVPDQPSDYDQLRWQGELLYQTLAKDHPRRLPGYDPFREPGEHDPRWQDCYVALALLDRHLAQRVREGLAANDEEEARLRVREEEVNDIRRAAEGR